MRSFEKVATLIIRDRKGGEMQVSAVLGRDAHYLHENRISLIGNRKKELELLRLSVDSVIDWEMFVRTDWKLSADPSYSHRQSGTGWLQTTGTAIGIMIADDSVQPFAEIEILEFHDRMTDGRLKGPRAEYVFLQRPRNWHAGKINWRDPDPPRRAGAWTSVKSAGLRFRLVRLAHERDDDRTAKERERFSLPGVEIAPIGVVQNETDFFSAADNLWFLIRVLLAFRFRQFVYTLLETKLGNGFHDNTWHSIRLEPREPQHGKSDGPFLAVLEPYLAAGAKALLAMHEHRELMHAAVYGYALSFKSGAMESGITGCVEAIERLLEAFERSRQLDRELIDRGRWKKLSKEIRGLAQPCVQTGVERLAVQKALGPTPTMSLLERIARMVDAMPRKWRGLSDDLLKGAPSMIKTRNDIVHGRLVDDYNALRIELLRAQSLFEWLWLCLMNCGNIELESWPLHAIQMHDASLG